MVGVDALYVGGHLPKPIAGKLTWRPSAIDLVQVCGVGLILHAACSERFAFMRVQQARIHSVGHPGNIQAALQLVVLALIQHCDMGRVTAARSRGWLLVKICRHMLLNSNSAALLPAICHATQAAMPPLTAAQQHLPCSASLCRHAMPICADTTSTILTRRLQAPVQLKGRIAHHELKRKYGGVILVLDAMVGIRARQQHVDVILVRLLDPAVRVEKLLGVARPNDLHKHRRLWCCGFRCSSESIG